jgi:prepilin-type N-terminal cleavage/methylation domain-containing protein
MYLLGFFFMARLLPPIQKANLHGFTLVELLVCLSISAVLLGFALPSVWR